MKKFGYLFLALVLCISLTACGGDDVASDDGINDTIEENSTDGPTDEQLEALTEAYNEVAVPYNDMATVAQENGWAADEETVRSIQAIGDTLEPIGLALTGDMSALEGADFDALPDSILDLKSEIEELAKKVSVPFEGEASVVTDEALTSLAEAYNEIAPFFNETLETAEANGWLNDEQTSAELDALTGVLSYVGSGLTDDPSKLEDADIDALIEKLQELGAALEEIAERVSVPYENVG